MIKSPAAVPRGRRLRLLAADSPSSALLTCSAGRPTAPQNKAQPKTPAASTKQVPSPLTQPGPGEGPRPRSGQGIWSVGQIDGAAGQF